VAPPGAMNLEQKAKASLQKCHENEYPKRSEEEKKGKSKFTKMPRKRILKKE
jgi:hypothetical protein